MLRNWFNQFPDGVASLTVESDVAARSMSSGYLLFVSFTYGWANFLCLNQNVDVRIRVHLATGETLKARAKIRTPTDPTFLEGLVPGITEQIRHPSSWNLVASPTDK
jgi:hypothetical protein